MSLNSAQGVLQVTTNTTAIAVTGLSFNPSSGTSVLFLWGATTTNGNQAVGHNMAFGIAIDSTHRGCVAAATRDSGDGGGTTRNIIRNGHCYTLIKRDVSAEDAHLAFTSWDSAGFTVTPSAAFVSTYDVHWAVINSSSLTAELKIFQVGTGTGNESQTGLTVLPTFIFGFSAGEITTTINTVGTSAGGITMGAAASSSSRATAAMASANAGSANLHRMIRTDRWMTFPRFDSATERLNLDFVSFNNNGGGDYGFTYSIARSTGTAQPQIVALCLGGESFECGSFSSHTSTGNFTGRSGGSFQPAFTLCWSSLSGNSSQTSASSNSEMSIGGAQDHGGVITQGAVWTLAPTAAQDCSMLMSSSQVALDYLRASADTFTVEQTIAYVSSDSGGFTLNQTDATAAAAELFAYASFGPLAAASGAPKFLPESLGLTPFGCR